MQIGERVSNKNEVEADVIQDGPKAILPQEVPGAPIPQVRTVQCTFIQLCLYSFIAEVVTTNPNRQPSEFAKEETTEIPRVRSHETLYRSIC